MAFPYSSARLSLLSLDRSLRLTSGTHVFARYWLGGAGTATVLESGPIGGGGVLRVSGNWGCATCTVVL